MASCVLRMRRTKRVITSALVQQISELLRPGLGAQGLSLEHFEHVEGLACTLTQMDRRSGQVHDIVNMTNENLALGPDPRTPHPPVQVS